MIDIGVVPHFIKAKTPEMLVRKMLSIQSRDGIKYSFRDINRSDGNWYAWYDKKFNENKLKKEVENGIREE